MEFDFEVNPDLDLAIGLEMSASGEAEGFYDDDTVVDEMNPMSPTGAKPGSESKVQMLAARYAAGVPLWHDSDCYDHGPAGVALLDEEESEFLQEVED